MARGITVLVLICIASVFAQRGLFDGSIACEPKPLSMFTTPTTVYGTIHGHRPPSTSCASNSASGAWWGSFAVPQGSIVMLSTCDSYTNFETVISVYSGSCFDLKCETTLSQSNCTSLSWTSNGQIAHVAIQGLGNQSGDFALTTTLSQIPSQTTCSAPIKIPISSKGILLLKGNLDYGSGSNTPCSSTNTPVVWYAIETPSDAITHFESGTCAFGGNAEMQIYSGSCSSLQCLDYGCDVDEDLALNSVYLIAITKSADAQTSDYLIEMNWESHPPNSCQNPDYAYGSPYYSTGNYCNTAGGTALTNDPCGKASGTAYWFHLSVTTGFNVTVSTCYFDTDPAFDTFLTVYSGSCSSLQCVTFNDDGPYCSYTGSSVTSQVSWTATQSEYFVVISGVNGKVGDSALYVFETRPYN